MNEKGYKKKFEFQEEIISKQSEQIKLLRLQIESLENECKEKDEIINSITPLRNKLSQIVEEAKRYKKEYKELVDELRKMKEILNQEVYKGKWNLVKFLIK